LSGVAFGTALPLSLLGAPGAIALRTLDELSLGAAEASLLGPLGDLYQGDLALGPSAQAALQALRTLERLRREPDRPPADAAYADDDLSRGLRLVARLIKEDLGLRAATLDLPGWDSHVLQAQVMEPLMRSLAAGLAAFARDLGRRLARTSVLVMTEFGRRVGENSALGTDHGRGSVLFVLGAGGPGGVQGRWPGLGRSALEGPGDVAVANDFREVVGAVLHRHGARGAGL
jgi:uncharacterized protein (DUF1501 family)